MIGTVVYWDIEKCWGYLSDGERVYFFQMDSKAKIFPELWGNVQFDIAKDNINEHKEIAVNVTVIKEGGV